MSIIKNSLSNIFKAHDKDDVSKNEPILKNTKGSVMIISGKKRTGKTSLWLSMLSSRQLFGNYFGNVFMISPSKEDKTRELREELEKEEKYYPELNEANVKSILDYIKMEISQQKRKEEKLKRKLPPIYNLLILDDVVADMPRSFKKNIITNLFFNHRHYNLTIFVITQSYKQIAPSIRKQADLLYIFPMANLKEKEAFQDDWDISNEVFDLAFQDEHEHPFLTVNMVGNKPVFFRKFDRIKI
jgi:hypothetical protein